MIGAGGLGTMSAHKMLTKESAGFSAPELLTRAMVITPATYLYSGLQESKVRKGEPIGDIENLVRKHPFITSLLASWLSGKALNSLSKYSSLNSAMSKCLVRMPENKFDNLYNDIINLK